MYVRAAGAFCICVSVYLCMWWMLHNCIARNDIFFLFYNELRVYGVVCCLLSVCAVVLLVDTHQVHELSFNFCCHFYLFVAVLLLFIFLSYIKNVFRVFFLFVCPLNVLWYLWCRPYRSYVLLFHDSYNNSTVVSSSSLFVWQIYSVHFSSYTLQEKSI